MTDQTIIPRILEDSPVVVKSDWLPQHTEFSELNELQAEHLDTLADLRDISAQIHALRAKYQAEDDQAIEAARQAYASGEDAKPVKRTPNQQREKAMTELNERGLVAQEHLRAVCTEVITTTYENLAEWSATLREHEREAQAKVQELRVLIQEAEAQAGQAPDLRVWLERTARGRNNPAQLIHWGWFTNEKPTTDLLSIANQGRNEFNSQASQALKHEMAGGGEDPDVNAVPDYTDEVHRYDTLAYQEELQRNLQRHVAERRAGDNTPGGL